VWYLHYKKPKAQLELQLSRSKADYKAGKLNLLTLRSLKDGRPKELEVRLEELDHCFTRIEIKAGSVALLSPQVQGVATLLRSFAAFV